MQTSKEMKKNPWKSIWDRVGPLTVKETGEKMIVKTAAGVGVFVLGLILSLGKLPMDTYPLGIAFLCASGEETLWAAAGFALGGIWTPYPLWYQTGVAVLVLLLRISARLFVDVPSRLGEKIGIRDTFSHLKGRIFCESLYLRVTVSCVGVFALSMYAVISGGFRYYDLFGAFVGLAAAPLATCLYDGAFIGRDKPLWQGASAAAICISLCLSLAGKRVWGIDMPLMLGFIGTLYTEREHGLLWGCLTGIGCGFLVGLYSMPAFLAVVIALFCLSDTSPRVGAAAALLGGTAGGILGGGSFWTLFLAFFCGTALYMTADRIRREKWLSGEVKQTKPSSFFGTERLYTEELEAQRRGLAAMAKALEHIGQRDEKTGSSPSYEESRHICAEAIRGVCDGCVQRQNCHRDHGAQIAESAERMASELQQGENNPVKGGRELSLICPHCNEMIDQIKALGGQWYRNDGERIGLSNVKDAYRRFGQCLTAFSEGMKEEFEPSKKEASAIKKRLKELGFEIEGVLVTGKHRKRICLWKVDPYPDNRQREYLQKQMEKCLGVTLDSFCPAQENKDMWLCRQVPQIKVTVGHAHAAGEEICGDLVRVFSETEEGRFYALLCDGMGMGAGAEQTARVSCDFLEETLTGGFGGEISLRLLNRYLPAALNRETSCSIDLLQLDTQQGKLTCYKCGAAPTFVKRGKNLFRLSSVSVPIGILPEIDAGQTSLDGKPGDVYVMVSDGITGGENECPWLLSYLDSTMEENPQAMARYIVEAAGTHGSTDDRSAVVIRIA